MTNYPEFRTFWGHEVLKEVISEVIRGMLRSPMTLRGKNLGWESLSFKTSPDERTGSNSFPCFELRNSAGKSIGQGLSYSALWHDRGQLCVLGDQHGRRQRACSPLDVSLVISWSRNSMLQGRQTPFWPLLLHKLVLPVSDLFQKDVMESSPIHTAGCSDLHELSERFVNL